MIAFFRDQANASRTALEAAVASSNYHVAAVNVRGEFTCRIAQGLIQWRIDSGSPVEPFKQAVERNAVGMRTLSALESHDVAKDVYVAEAAIISFLVDMPSPTFNKENLVTDCLLDAVLADALRGSWDEIAWNKGLSQLRKNKRSGLACETYLVYERLLNTASANANTLVDEASELFQKRSRDGFYTGGPATEGGGPDNKYTVDYRLAAIIKKIGFTGQTIHRWRW